MDQQLENTHGQSLYALNKKKQVIRYSFKSKLLLELIFDLEKFPNQKMHKMRVQVSSLGTSQGQKSVPKADLIDKYT